MSRVAILPRAAALVLATLLSLTASAHAAEAPADTTVEGYVRAMADSTDRWFGITALPTDTTGLDSSRAFVLAHPNARPRQSWKPSFTPLVSFSRVLGLAPGIGTSIGSVSEFGRIRADAQWAPGPDTWLGAVELGRNWSDPLETNTWSVALRGGRGVAALDRDYFAPSLSKVRALVAGADGNHYERLDGALFTASHTAPGWSAGVSARDQLESPMVTTATWYLFGHGPVPLANNAAVRLRVHEAGAWGVLRLPRLPYRIEAHVWRAGGGLGGDTSYTRVTTSLGGATALGRHLTLTTQTGYARVTGAALPQNAFYVGGPTLYTAAENGMQGSGRALARAELLLTDPLQRLLGFDPRPAFPIQLGAFAGTAARWGFDPLTGRAQLTARDWPGRSAWMSEAGFSVMYRPGLPDPDSFVSASFAYPLGPGGRSNAIVVTYTRVLNFLQHH